MLAAFLSWPRVPSTEHAPAPDPFVFPEPPGTLSQVLTSGMDMPQGHSSGACSAASPGAWAHACHTAHLSTWVEEADGTWLSKHLGLAQARRRSGLSHPLSHQACPLGTSFLLMYLAKQWKMARCLGPCTHRAAPQAVMAPGFSVAHP